MIRTNFTKMPAFNGAFLTLFLLIGSFVGAVAQPMVCNNQVQVSVDPTPNACQAIIDVDMILEGDPLSGVNYSIMIKKGLSIIATGTNSVTLTNSYQHFGAQLTATVTNLSNGNSCWGGLTLEDKLPPVITCTDVTVSCTANLGNVGPATAVDNCDATPTVQLSSETINTSTLCTQGFLTVSRSYIAFDDYGNTSAPCTRNIIVQRPSEVDFPNDVIWTCDQYNANQAIVDPTPAGSGIVANIANNYCNYQQSSHDEIVPSCGNTFKIIRTWAVLDWCTGTVVTSGVGGEDNVQVIKIMDSTPPVVTIAPYTVDVTYTATHPQVCASQGFLQPANVTDNCNSTVVKIYTPVGEAVYVSGGNGSNGGFIPAPGLAIGTHTITYVATDACNNQTSQSVQITVVDATAPVAICDDVTDVNLSSDGYATVLAQTFDDGSYDNCCLSHFEVRRMTDPCNDNHNDLTFGPSVKFCCADVNSIQTVIFRAYDCHGQTNDCMVDVHVSDKLNPVLVSCPANQRISCDVFADNLETSLQGLSGAQINAALTAAGYGSASFYDNCEAIVSGSASINLDQCLEGSITRTWSAKDPSNNSSTQNCTQTIFVDHVSDWVVEFPADLTANCGSSVPDFGEPEIFSETCELVGVSHNDQIFTVVPDACYKIERTWTVINWCVVGNEIDQEVVEATEQAMNLDLDGDGDKDNRTYRDSWTVSSKPAAAQATQSTNPDTDSDSDPWDGYIIYKQVIKVNDTVDPIFTSGCSIPDVCIDGNNCATTVVLPQQAITECSPNVTLTARVKIGGVWLNGFGPYNNVGPGTYEVLYNAKDNCNNQKDCSTTVTVKDCKKPTPYCKNGLVIELMQNGTITVNVADFNAGSYDNCTSQSQLKLSFASNAIVTTASFDCDNIGSDNEIQLHVTDLAGNSDFCTTFIEIQDNMNACPGSNPLVAVGGAIANESNASVSGVTVNLSGQSTGTVTTNNSGSYNFASIPAGNDITVAPQKDDNPLNGVTTFDLVLISKHILGAQLLDSPFKMIAADANKSNSITTFDLVEIRKLILQIIPAFSNNTSWRFVKKSYSFPNPSNPFAEQFAEVVNINDVASNVLNADFVAVKIGDVNGSAATNFAAGDDRTFNGSFVMNADDRLVQKGEVVTVDFTAADLDIAGYQFTMNFDMNSLELVELLPGLANEDNFGFTLVEKGAITTSWNGNADNASLFSLVFRAKADGQLSSLLSVNSRFTAAEAYASNGDLLDVQLSFNGNTANGFALYQNTPNPFKGQTTIGFNLPEAGAATLTITDISGKVISMIERDFAKGYNEIRINSSELPATGVLYYTLKSATETATKKMVIVE